MGKNIKIGIIQNFSICGDFSKNLRAIVQGYRQCLDQGADLVISSAYSLCGAEVGDLASRDSFLEQTQRALSVLSKEINCAPLILAAYSTQLNAEEICILSREGNIELEDNLCSLKPYLLHNGVVAELYEAALLHHQQYRYSIEIGDEESISELELDFTIRLSTQTWYCDRPAIEAESHSWEAEMNHCALISVAPVGMAEDSLYMGGSALYNSQGELLSRLGYFCEENRVVDLAASPLVGEVEENQKMELLHQALVLAIRQSVEQRYYKGVCLAMDHPYAPLLLLLAVQALGASRVHALCFAGADAHAEALGVRCHHLTLQGLARDLHERCELGENQLESTAQRLQACCAVSIAESTHCLLLSPLNRQQLILGEYTDFAQTTAHLLPLGSLYEMELYELIKQLMVEHHSYFVQTPLPTRPELGRIIHLTQDQNRSSGELLRESAGGFLENDVRYVQRRSASSALKHAPLPRIIQTQASENRHDYPRVSRLQD